MVTTIQDLAFAAQRRERCVFILEAALFASLAVATAWSAAYIKRYAPLGVPPLAAVTTVKLSHAPERPLPPVEAPAPSAIEQADEADLAADEIEAPPLGEELPETQKKLFPPGTRWFNGRPVRPARQMWMTVTAYSPDERSCPGTADGITATLHSVWTNNMRMVAADTRLLPFGSLVSVPGYAGGEIVPVLDRGGAIKGRRLDVLYATHEIARQWGVQRVKVTVWDYADGKPADNPRKLR